MRKTEPKSGLSALDDDLQEAAEELRILFAMSPAEIAQALEQAARNNAPIVHQWLAYARKIQQGASLTPAENARGNHLGILLAHAFAHREGVPVELALYNVAFACTDLQNAAFTVASEKGRLAELQDRLDIICQRAGLPLDQFWPTGKAPADYHELRKEFGRLADQVDDTFFAALLRRYHFFEFATLFEEDRMRFEVMRYVGERLSREHLEMRLRKHRLKTLVEHFGPAAKDLLAQMLRPHRLRLP